MNPPMKTTTRFSARLLATVLIVTSAVSPGCSLFVGSKQPVAINATDPDAELFVDGAPVGRGTATVDLKRNRSHAILAKTEDGRSATANIGTQISTTGVLDIVGGLILLVPFLGVVAPGFWMLDTEQVYLPVPPRRED